MPDLSTPAPTNLSSPPPEEGEPEFEPVEKSGYFKRLTARGTHSAPRLKAIRAAALKDLPPVEPPVWSCCGSSCGIDCVTTSWWEEEKTWRDCHEDWKEIKQRLKDEEEDRLREEEEERALNGDDGSHRDSTPPSPKTGAATARSSGRPAVTIEIEADS